MHLASLHVGGLVAVGFDPTGRYLLTVSHAGRGVFDTLTWHRVARDASLAYPVDGVAVGIGPIDGQRIPVTEISYENGTLQVISPNGNFSLAYESGVIAVDPMKK
jgi:hypothetical protein